MASVKCSKVREIGRLTWGSSRMITGQRNTRHRFRGIGPDRVDPVVGEQGLDGSDVACQHQPDGGSTSFARHQLRVGGPHECRCPRALMAEVRLPAVEVDQRASQDHVAAVTKLPTAAGGVPRHVEVRVAIPRTQKKQSSGVWGERRQVAKDVSGLHQVAGVGFIGQGDVGGLRWCDRSRVGDEPDPRVGVEYAGTQVIRQLGSTSARRNQSNALADVQARKGHARRLAPRPPVRPDDQLVGEVLELVAGLDVLAGSCVQPHHGWVAISVRLLGRRAPAGRGTRRRPTGWCSSRRPPPGAGARG